MYQDRCRTCIPMYQDKYRYNNVPGQIYHCTRTDIPLYQDRYRTDILVYQDRYRTNKRQIYILYRCTR